MDWKIIKRFLSAGYSCSETLRTVYYQRRERDSTLPFLDILLLHIAQQLQLLIYYMLFLFIVFHKPTNKNSPLYTVSIMTFQLYNLNFLKMECNTISNNFQHSISITFPMRLQSEMWDSLKRWPRQMPYLSNRQHCWSVHQEIEETSGTNITFITSKKSFFLLPDQDTKNQLVAVLVYAPFHVRAMRNNT